MQRHWIRSFPFCLQNFKEIHFLETCLMKVLRFGELLDGRYRIIQNLAEGGFGRTYVAEDIRLPGNPHCVVKHLKPPGSDNLKQFENIKRLFLNEAETLQKLGKHNQIPQLLAYFDENQDFYLVQELIGGHTLTYELKPGHKWDEVLVYKLLCEVLNILAFIHKNGVIHRDIKPDNLIRRDSDNKIVLVDFGTVKQVLLHGQPTTTIVAGTPGYMPTEQGRGKPRPNSDIYSLGIICIQALTGLLPNQLQEDPETGELVWSAWANCTDELANIIDRMVRYHFRERYQEAQDVLADLQLLLAKKRTVFVDGEYTSLSQSHTFNEQLNQSVTNLRPTHVSNQSNQPINNIYPVKKFDNSETIVSSSLAKDSRPTEETFKSNPQSTVVSSAPADKEMSSVDTSFGVPNPTVVSTDRNAVELSNINALPTILSSNSPQSTIVSTGSIKPPSNEVKTTYSNAEVSENISNSLSVFPSPNIRRKSILARKVWLFTGVGGLLVIIGLIIGTISVNRHQAYLQAENLASEARELKLSGNYEQCIEKAKTISSSHTEAYGSAQGLLGDCQLALAQQFAEEGSYSRAITIATEILPGHSAHQQANQLISQWSNRILQLAQEQYQSGKLDEAIAMIKAIPEGSPLHTRTLEQIEQWNQEWEKNEASLEVAKEAIDSQQWQQAIDEASKVTTNYWEQQASSIIQQASDELAAAARRREEAAAARRREEAAAARRREEAAAARRREETAAARRREETAAARRREEGRRRRQPVNPICRTPPCV
ncbi:MAG: protein kinase [Oculatellaceae cyanobacterium bins.114]|nr:protein kinase [Oculatellaceae cyanobacterium bins.114]